MRKIQSIEWVFFSIFSHKWVDLPNSKLEHRPIMPFEFKTLAKEKSLLTKIDQNHLNNSYEDHYFDQSWLDIPEIVADKPRQLVSPKKIIKRKAFRRNAKKLNNSIWDNVVSIFLSGSDSKKKYRNLTKTEFFHRPK